MTKFLNWEQLQKYAPVQNGIWNKQYLYEYLVQSCHCCFQKQISQFFNNYKCDEVFADLLFDILLDDDYDGSDAQIGAAYYISKLDKSVLKMKKEKLLQAQKNDVFWKRPFSKNDNLKWLNDDIAK